jgi:hypothetical protein
MSIGKILLYGLLFWFLYNLVFRFIIPIFKASRQMKQKFGEMQQQMQEQMRQQQEAQRPQPTPQTSSTPKTSGDYIDFEEVK